MCIPTSICLENNNICVVVRDTKGFLSQQRETTSKMTNFRFSCLKNKNIQAVLVVPADTMAFNITSLQRISVFNAFCFFVIALPIEKM